MSDLRLTAVEKRILKHALGLDRSKKPYRNHYCAVLVGPDKTDLDYLIDLDNLVVDGLLYRGTFSDYFQYYHCTKKGMAAVLPPDDPDEDDDIERCPCCGQVLEDC